MAGYVMHLDESLRGQLISVGGFICAQDHLPEVSRSWRGLRESIGLAEDEPFKWNYGQTSITRRRLEEEGWGLRERRAVVIEFLREAPVTLMADVLYDDRGQNRGPLDFYRFALDWLALRFRYYVTELRPIPTGPHYVVLDKPSPAPPARPPYNDPRFDWLRNREQIWYVHYCEKHRHGFTFPGGSVRALREDGFYPSVLVSHAKYNVLLEIADAIAGLALDFTHYNMRNANGEELPHVGWQDEQMIRLAGRFRCDSAGNIYRFGFMVFPDRTPAAQSIERWVSHFCTHPDYAWLR